MGEEGGDGEGDSSSSGMPKRKVRPLPDEPAPVAGTPRTSFATFSDTELMASHDPKSCSHRARRNWFVIN